MKFVFVGELEPFRDEVLAYVEYSKNAKIAVKFKLLPKAFHAFEALAPYAKITKEANQFLLDSYEEFYNKHCVGYKSKP